MLRTFRLIDAGALSAVVLLVAACTEFSAPTAPTGQFRTELITCQASVSAGTLTCASSQPQGAPHVQPARGLSFDLILGGQGALVRLASSGTAYNAGTFTSDVTVENLIAQPMNTADGTTPDAGGIKVFFHSGPTATGGTGTVSVANADGTGTFTGSNQPFFLYSSGAVLASGATTSTKPWEFTVPTTVTTFMFEVFVTTRLPDEASAIVALGLSRTPSALTIAPGGSGTTTVLLTRTNFTGAVTLSLASPPVGVTGSFNPSAPTGASSTLTLDVGSGVTPGVYPLTVEGTGSAGTRTTPLTLTVGTGGTGNVTVDFSSCPVAERPVWLAAQNGTNPWARVTGAGDIYTFTIGSGGGGLAYVLLGAGDVSTVTVQYMAQAELTAGTLVFCPPTAGKTINGTVAGADLTDISTVSLGGRSATVLTFLSSSFQLTEVPDGAQDLVAYRHSLAGGAESAIIRRNQNIADNGSVGALDFGGVEAFTPATATITLSGLLGGEEVIQGMFYQVGANCATAALYSLGPGGATFTASGIPSGQQLVTDFHGLNVTALSSDETAFRLITQYNHTLAARTVTLGAAMPTPTVTSLGGLYKRLQAEYTLPTDYQGSTGFEYNDAAGKSVSIFATFGYLGGATTTLALADYSGLSGWDNNWAPASSSTGDWTVLGTSPFPGSACTEDASFKTATVSGTF
ncbi:MAG: hypothetical protein OEO20_10525 [Gemmatimonadota bacterium]|nr:hypothetical protein [Gemmatimonadota bacterium]MDH3478728.1 hypothetical protein [Gemmatimonadota bacterium]MDH3570304.1 hypothetical protein [Gemmatimonadota bacterium]MDH5549590.1 hypothetical protein [Gemmatimonadota bacterium]